MTYIKQYSLDSTATVLMRPSFSLLFSSWVASSSAAAPRRGGGRKQDIFYFIFYGCCRCGWCSLFHRGLCGSVVGQRTHRRRCFITYFFRYCRLCAQTGPRRNPSGGPTHQPTEKTKTDYLKLDGWAHEGSQKMDAHVMRRYA